MRLAALLALAGAFLFAAAPSLAAKPVTPAATVTVSGTAAYGGFVNFSVSANATPTDVAVVCAHDGTASFWNSRIYDDEVYTTRSMGLYAPNWSSGGATCAATVQLYIVHNYHYRTQAIGSVTFEVAP